MAGHGKEKLAQIQDDDLRMYMRSHGFSVSDEFIALVNREGSLVVLTEMKAVLKDFEDDMESEGIPVWVVAKEERAIDFTLTISGRLEERRRESSSAN